MEWRSLIVGILNNLKVYDSGRRDNRKILWSWNGVEMGVGMDSKLFRKLKFY
jgi:hypothetical protein